MSPSWDYLAHVLAPTLGRAGLDLQLEAERRGFYPKGGGRVNLGTEPLGAPLEPLRPRATRDPVIEGTIVWSGLPDHIPRRIDHAIRKGLVGLDVARVRKKHVEADSPGVVATLWADLGEAVVGASMAGRRGLPSEEIGNALAAEVRADVEAGATVDVHLVDQLVVHAVLAGGTSKLRARDVTPHARTAIEVASAFCDLEVAQTREGGLSVLSLGPAGA
jgi:RNA 3'-terminal phosphate cyclase (ATP)